MITNKIKAICRYLRKSQYGYKKPEIFINLTYSCPLRCKYCYVDYNKKSNFDLENLIYLFEEGILKTNYMKLVTFFGGEPLLRIDLIETILERFYDRLCEKGIHIAVITSMSCSRTKQIELIKKYPLYETVISFDYYSGQRVYNGGNPFKVLDYIDLEELQQYHNNICFHVVLANKKSFEDLMLLQDIFSKYGFIYSWCWNKTPTEVFDFKEDYKKIIHRIIKEDKYYPSAFTKEYDSLKMNNLGCGVGSELFISADGDISPCSISHHNNEFLLMKDGIIQDGVPENIQDVENNVFNNEYCKNCSIKGFCNGGCLFERKKNRGDYNSVNTVLCEQMKQLYETYQEILQELTPEIKQHLDDKIFDNIIGNIDYCYNTHINIDMYDYFNLGK